MKVVTQGEDCSIKLYDFKTGIWLGYEACFVSELGKLKHQVAVAGQFFAECPIPKPEVAPLTVVNNATSQ